MAPDMGSELDRAKAETGPPIMVPSVASPLVFCGKAGYSAWRYCQTSLPGNLPNILPGQVSVSFVGRNTRD
jgi:hypothetical protein